ncbi:protein FAR1-RELATED SEQUENCE 9-like [Diospyros lotus]|uniref:protein FAR1-RELATED SEQUENCE 9-like n=1 Tax=Diospyros lotus TaxID=55363 RepID=UPI0022577E9B|nr:protein FAR1-RELATED SEQUENCE 9-like [Diospyros lotus]XP_052197724.1 protein FAR1-RELATED SEQUENCE 9-like [Diospyros lotus]XP_052197733.1 protein FAR1-RELATED SEQUENCE 9-like [Diospyros lotus]
MNSGGRHRNLGGGVHHVLDYLKRMQAENPAFFYAIQADNEHSTGNIFWADANCRMNYNYFGDTVRLDTTYRRNHFRVPFASFTGLNHHGQPVLFGSALLLNESDSAFLWLIQTWLHAMSGRFPISVTTDRDRLIQMAVSQVLPETRHRFCKWSIFQETQEKLAHIYQQHSTFDLEFKKCVNETESVSEFESCWESLLQRYYLLDNEWLQSMYAIQHQWVPVYMRDTFFGELSRNISGPGITNSFFDGYVNATTSIQMLIKQYEKAVASWHEKELKADYDTTTNVPVLKTPSPMEKQAASFYTKRIFLKFQEELVETLANPATRVEDSGTTTTYQVAKFGEEHKAHTVRFNAFEMKANCSCQMFEFSGIICRHVLSVFRSKNVLTLPSDYILKRWTRNAKSGGVIDGQALELPNDSQESLTVRYNNLRQEAIKFVEEGAKSIHIYNVAMEALQEAAKKVATAKKKSFTKSGTLANGDGQEVHTCEENEIMSLQSSDEKEKKIRELTAQLESTNQRCEVYRGNLLAILRDMEDQKLKLSVKVQNARLSLKE